MLGYKIQDVIVMQDAVVNAIDYARDLRDEEVVKGLLLTLDMLYGMVSEGRI